MKVPEYECFYVVVVVCTEVMPADSASDFDAHLQHSIMSLQQLNSALAKDVAILYSPRDIPSNAETDKVRHFFFFFLLPFTCPSLRIEHYWQGSDRIHCAC
jgi:hypothetical protein